MAPRPDQRAALSGVAREQPEDRVAVGVVPSADHVHGAGDRREVLAHGALLPELVAPLMRRPGHAVGRRRSHAREPVVAPALPHDGRIGRLRVDREHRRRPREAVPRKQAAAHVVDVVGVAVVGRAHADHGPERGRVVRGDLETVEAAPRLADDADAARAPRLGRQPGDDLDPIELLLRQVLVLHNPVRVARAAHVDPHRGVAVAGEVLMDGRIPQRRAVVLAVRDVLEHRGDRLAPGVPRHPDARGQATAVCERDPCVLDDPHRAREVRYGPRGCACQHCLSGARLIPVGPRRYQTSRSGKPLSTEMKDIWLDSGRSTIADERSRPHERTQRSIPMDITPDPEFTPQIALSRRALIRRAAIAAAALPAGAALLEGFAGTAAADDTGQIVLNNYPGWIGKNELAAFAKKYPGDKVKMVTNAT